MTGLPVGTVTFLLTDIEGSTLLLQQLGAERYRTVLAEHEQLVRTQLTEHGGVELGTEGDSFFVAFGRAAAALAAAVAIQQALAGSSLVRAAGLRIRLALHTGEPTLAGGRYIGLDLHRAARLREAGHGGQILLSALTRELVVHDLPPGVGLRDLGEHRLRDLPRAERLFQLEIEGLPNSFPPLRGLETRPNNLPTQLTSFIGRERVAVEVAQLLDRARLVTLTGPGGSGKTRLAIQVAAGALPSFAAGAFFIGLASLADSALVVPTTAQTLGVHTIGTRPPLEGLKDFLRDRQQLLILDNFEQVLSAGPEIVELLTTCPLLKILITSRTVLRVSGEREYAVPPLALPGPSESSPAELSQNEAVQLFSERAQAVRADFRLSDELAATVAEICRRLDGLPLALELAAARVRLLPPAAILGRLEHRLQLLTGGARDRPTRQRTLRDAIAWSYDLLDQVEQALFRRLAVFVGGCTLEAAEAVCDGEVLDGLAALVDQSLLQQKAAGPEPRFTMLETIREYAREQLEASGELDSIQRGHAEHYLDLAEQAERWLVRKEAGVWLDRLELEHDNLRAALAWSEQTRDSGDLFPRLAAALWMFWWLRGHISEGRGWLERALDRATEPAERTRVLLGLGDLATFQGDYPRSRELFTEQIALGRASGDQNAVAQALARLAATAQATGDYERAGALAEESLALSRQLGEKVSIAHSLHAVKQVAISRGDYERAEAAGEEALQLFREAGIALFVPHELRGLATVALARGELGKAASLLQESLDLCQRQGDHWGAYLCLAGLMQLSWRQGDVGRMLALARQKLAISRDLGDRPGIAGVLESLTWVARVGGDPGRAARLLGAAEVLRESFGWRGGRGATELGLVQAELTAVQATLGEASFAAARAVGRALSLDEAVAEALAVEVRPATPPEKLTNPAGLTPREVEVLRLLATGQTSREIAATLVVSIATVDRHLTHIYDKIGVRGRAAATAFALKHGLA